MRRSFLFIVAALAGGLLLFACEEGPEQIYQSNPDDLDLDFFNGWRRVSQVIEGKRPFEIVTSEKQEGTTVLCLADQLQETWAKMIKEPIKPMFGAGGLNMRGEPEWSGLTVDQAQQKLCQAYIGDDIAAWGDNYELLAFFDPKTRLIDGLVTLQGYEGAITAGDFVIGVGHPVMKNGKEIKDADTEENIKALNVALLKAFRPEIKNPEQRDCLGLNTCVSIDYKTFVLLIFRDVSTYVVIEPKNRSVVELHVYFNRSFEVVTGDVKFETSPMPLLGLPPTPKIEWSTSCRPTLGMTWKHIKDNCLGFDPEEKALTKPVWSNEALMADMGGLSVFMTRPSLPVDQFLPDTTNKAEESDVIVGMDFTANYEGNLAISQNKLFSSFFSTLADQILAHEPTLDLHDRFSHFKPVGEDLEKLSLGTQRLQDCKALPCTEDNFVALVKKIVTSEAQTTLGQVPDTFKDLNFYVEIFLRELLRIFNDNKPPKPSEIYFYVTDETAEIMIGKFTRVFNDDIHSVTVAYYNKTDQILDVFFKKGTLRPEQILYKDAELPQGKLPGDGVFRLSNLINSTRLGLGNKIEMKKDFPALQRALVTAPLDKPTDVLTYHHKKDSLSGYLIPVDGQRSNFIPAAQYGFSGFVIGATFYVDDENMITAISSGAFYDKVDFCGSKIALNDPVWPMLKSLPASCNVIYTYSENGKFLTGVSVYVPNSSPTIGLYLSVLAGRVDGARYWVEE